MPRICLVTTAHLSQNPRLLKEADALHEAGFDVRVVSVVKVSECFRTDRILMASRRWTIEYLDVTGDSFPSRFRWIVAGIRQRLAGRLRQTEGKRRGLIHSFSRYAPELVRMAVKAGADLYIAHNLEALPAAYLAADKTRALLGFDAEDFHRGQYPDSAMASKLVQEIISVEKWLIPRCSYVTAASEGIAQAYAEALGIPLPPTILNVFPLSEKSGHVPAGEIRNERKGGTWSLYWYSQVIGPDRGLQDALRALALLGPEVHLHLRGNWAEGYEREFTDLTHTLGISERVHILKSVPPDQLVERAACHNIGLAIEQPVTKNRDICLTNKLFTYLLAGIPAVASDTSAQRNMAGKIPDVIRLYTFGRPEMLAQKIQDWISDPESYRKARCSAEKAGLDEYNWDTEKNKLLANLRHFLLPTAR